MKKQLQVLATALVLLTISPAAMAADGDNGWIGMGAGLAMGLAVIGGALAQGNAARGMYESVSRNPGAADKLNTPFFVGMAFIESLVLFTFVIAFLLQGKIG
jgi:F-type H+-transporting ATPase subunit c